MRSALFRELAIEYFWGKPEIDEKKIPAQEMPGILYFNFIL